MMKLAIEIYERKVVEVVKTEGMDPEQKEPLAILYGESPSGTVSPDGAFQTPAHGMF
jgi:hypothetical protein